MSETRTVPQADETWRARDGRERRVTFVNNENDLADDGRWCIVFYERPPPAIERGATVTLKAWWEWVERTQAVRTQKTWRAP